jgi:hypothetical protein
MPHRVWGFGYKCSSHLCINCHVLQESVAMQFWQILIWTRGCTQLKQSKVLKTTSVLSKTHPIDLIQKKMQQTREVNTTENQPLREKHVRDLTVDKRRLVEVPYTASLAHTMNALVANRVVAVPVAAPPGHWIGAGGSMIMESDKQTGVVRKHYIGIVTMLDMLAHIAGDDKIDGGDGSNLDQKMAAPVSSIIGHCLEGLSLWTLNPNTR